MASDDKEKETESATDAPVEGADPSTAGSMIVVEGDAGSGAPDEPAATGLGSRRYVHAAFLAIGITIAYLSGKVLTLIWNNLADWSSAVAAVPQLIVYAEDQRESFSLVAGALIGVVAGIRMYRNIRIRTFADDVATELSKVTWPNREAVMNGTVVVMIASAIATVYVAVLDRFWGFLTTLVYGT